MNFENTATQNYLNTLQGIINRMATNSSACKNWCISIVSAILVFSTTTKQASSIWVALIPCIMFAWLDAYYLGMERQFVDIYKKVVENIKNGIFEVNDLYSIKIDARGFKGLLQSLKAFNSLSIFPFYILITLSILILSFWIK